MGSSSGGAPVNDSMVELFGRCRRRPLLSNTLRSLSIIYSLFQEENPFVHFADCNHTPADCLGDDSAPRSEKKASIELDGRGSLEIKNLPIHDELTNEGTPEVLCKDGAFNGSEMIIDELNGGKETETADKVASNEDTIDHMAVAHNVAQGLVGIERILMDESDDLGLLQMSDKDVNFDILKDFGSFMDNDGFGNNSVPVESSGNDELPVEGNTKEDVVIEDKGKDMEAKNSISEGNARQPHADVPVEREKYGSSEVGNKLAGASTQDAGKKEAKVNRRKFAQNLSEIGGLTFSAQSSKNEGGTISGGKAVDSIKKGHKSGALDKGKIKKSKKAALKDVKSGKRKHISMDGGGSKRTKSGGADSAAVGKMPEQNVQVHKEKSSAKLVGKRVPTKGVKFQYTREQLMHLREPAAVPKDISEVVKEISAQLHGEEKSPSGKSATDTVQSNERQSGPCLGDKKAEEKDATVCSKGQLGTSTEDTNAKEMVSGILKKKKRGSSSETRKEKKKVSFLL